MDVLIQLNVKANPANGGDHGPFGSQSEAVVSAFFQLLHKLNGLHGQDVIDAFQP